MKNADMPAMPQNVAINDAGDCECPERAVGSGLTKREMFAMHAPQVPEWFEKDWKESNCGDNEFFVKVDAYCEFSNSDYQYLDVSIKGQMALMKAWRYAYADLMLEE